LGGQFFKGEGLSGRIIPHAEGIRLSLPAEFFTAYKNSGKIIFEIPPNDTGNQGQLVEFLGGAIYTDGTTLKDHVSSEAYAKAEKFCKERNYPLELYRLFKPALFVMTLTVQEMNRIGADPQKGVDYFSKKKLLRTEKLQAVWRQSINNWDFFSLWKRL